ncbi:TPA: hypothetical protein ACG3P3_001490 [Clostridioides difficile]
MYNKGDKTKLACINCEGIEDQEFIEYFYESKESIMKERWKCCNCNENNDIYPLKDTVNI